MQILTSSNIVLIKRFCFIPTTPTFDFWIFLHKKILEYIVKYVLSFTLEHMLPTISQKYYLDVIKQTIDDSNIVTYLPWSLQHISTWTPAEEENRRSTRLQKNRNTLSVSRRIKYAPISGFMLNTLKIIKDTTSKRLNYTINISA